MKPAFFRSSPSWNASVTGCRTSQHQLCKIIRIFSDVVSYKSFLYLIQICPKIPFELNSSGLEVFKLDRFGVDGFDPNRLGLVTCEDYPRPVALFCEGWDLC